MSRIICPACYGNTYTKRDCEVCHGTGEVCGTCNGAGFCLLTDCEIGSQARWVPCPTCQPGKELAPRAESKPAKRKGWNHYAD